MRFAMPVPAFALLLLLAALPASGLDSPTRGHFEITVSWDAQSCDVTLVASPGVSGPLIGDRGVERDARPCEHLPLSDAPRGNDPLPLNAHPDAGASTLDPINALQGALDALVGSASGADPSPSGYVEPEPGTLPLAEGAGANGAGDALTYSVKVALAYDLNWAKRYAKLDGNVVVAVKASPSPAHDPRGAPEGSTLQFHREIPIHQEVSFDALTAAGVPIPGLKPTLTPPSPATGAQHDGAVAFAADLALSALDARDAPNPSSSTASAPTTPTAHTPSSTGPGSTDVPPTPAGTLAPESRGALETGASGNARKHDLDAPRAFAEAAATEEGPRVRVAHGDATPPEAGAPATLALPDAAASPRGAPTTTRTHLPDIHAASGHGAFSTPAPEPAPTQGAGAVSRAQQAPASGSPVDARSPGLALAALAITALAGLATAFALSAFSRVDPGRTLEHEARARIYNLLKTQPGLSAQEIAQALGVALMTAIYHLKRMQNADLIASRILRRRARFYIPGTQADLVTAEVTQTDVAKRIVEAVRTQPGMTLAQVSRAVSSAPPLCHYHVRNLLAANVLAAQGEGRKRVYLPGHATPAVLPPTQSEAEARAE